MSYDMPMARKSPTVGRPKIPVPVERYVSARDNPQTNVRPGADMHKQYRSLSFSQQAIYKDRGHA